MTCYTDQSRVLAGLQLDCEQLDGLHLGEVLGTHHDSRSLEDQPALQERETQAT